MNEGYKIIGKALKNLSENEHTKDVLKLPASNHFKISKFEGWLKIELGNQISKDDRIDEKKIVLEPHYPTNAHYSADISFETKMNNDVFFVELKTIRNYLKDREDSAYNGINKGNKRRRTVKDIEGLNLDIEKILALRSKSDKNIVGLVAFIIFLIHLKSKIYDIQRVYSKMKKIQCFLNACDLEENYSSINEQIGFVYGVIEPFQERHERVQMQ